MPSLEGRENQATGGERPWGKPGEPSGVWNADAGAANSRGQAAAGGVRQARTNRGRLWRAGREKGAAVSSFQWCTDAFSLIKDKPQGNEGSGGGHGNLIRALGCSGRSCEFSESGNDVTPSSSFLSAPGKAATEKQWGFAGSGLPCALRMTQI